MSYPPKFFRKAALYLEAEASQKAFPCLYAYIQAGLQVKEFLLHHIKSKMSGLDNSCVNRTYRNFIYSFSFNFFKCISLPIGMRRTTIPGEILSQWIKIIRPIFM